MHFVCCYTRALDALQPHTVVEKVRFLGIWVDLKAQN
jgi:hypothetical protein